MSFWTELRLPAQCDALVGVYDCHWLAHYAEKSQSLDEVLAVMAGFYAVTGEIVDGGGGRLVKTLGDSGLAIFTAERADDGVHALRKVKEVGEEWLGRRGYKSRIAVKADVGPVVLGLVGAPGREVMDVYGRPVATAFTMPSTGFSMTGGVFRTLAPGTRTLFKKHTPPIRYIAAEDMRPRERVGEE